MPQCPIAAVASQRVPEAGASQERTDLVRSPGRCPVVPARSGVSLATPGCAGTGTGATLPSRNQLGGVSHGVTRTGQAKGSRPLCPVTPTGRL